MLFISGEVTRIRYNTLLETNLDLLSSENAKYSPLSAAEMWGGAAFGWYKAF